MLVLQACLDPGRGLVGACWIGCLHSGCILDWVLVYSVHTSCMTILICWLQTAIPHTNTSAQCPPHVHHHANTQGTLITLLRSCPPGTAEEASGEDIGLLVAGLLIGSGLLMGSSHTASCSCAMRCLSVSFSFLFWLTSMDKLVKHERIFDLSAASLPAFFFNVCCMEGVVMCLHVESSNVVATCPCGMGMLIPWCAGGAKVVVYSWGAQVCAYLKRHYMHGYPTPSTPGFGLAVH